LKTSRCKKSCFKEAAPGFFAEKVRATARSFYQVNTLKSVLTNTSNFFGGR